MNALGNYCAQYRTHGSCRFAGDFVHLSLETRPRDEYLNRVYSTRQNYLTPTFFTFENLLFPVLFGSRLQINTYYSFQ